MYATPFSAAYAALPRKTTARLETIVAACNVFPMQRASSGMVLSFLEPVMPGAGGGFSRLFESTLPGAAEAQSRGAHLGFLQTTNCQNSMQAQCLNLLFPPLLFYSDSPGLPPPCWRRHL